jgi:hypothetical protein
MNCIWCIWNKEGKTPCERAATALIIYGCLEGHLTEYPYCWQHANLWETYFTKRIISCGHVINHKTCNKIVADWDFIDI